jgi:hypothetical protein
MQELSTFSKLTQRMQNERERMGVDESPFLMLTNRYNKKKSFTGGILADEDFPFMNPAAVQVPESSSLPVPVQSSTSSALAGKANNKKVTVVPKGFSQRYEDEMATTQQLKMYDSFSTQYKSQLLKEANILKTRFSEEMSVVHQMETNVNAISSMLTQFVGILQEQTDVVDGVHELAVDTTEFVKDTDEELCITIERSNQNSRNMVMIITILACLLILLDFLTP